MKHLRKYNSVHNVPLRNFFQQKWPTIELCKVDIYFNTLGRVQLRVHFVILIAEEHIMIEINRMEINIRFHLMSPTRYCINIAYLSEYDRYDPKTVHRPTVIRNFMK